MSKYHVEFRAYSTGEWYSKTKTDSYPAAESVCCHSNGRDARITDTHTKKVISSHPGDASMYDAYKRR